MIRFMGLLSTIRTIVDRAFDQAREDERRLAIEYLDARILRLTELKVGWAGGAMEMDSRIDELKQAKTFLDALPAAPRVTTK